jgi:protein-S-isoprenylcysteine O-methyltransferase
MVLGFIYFCSELALTSRRRAEEGAAGDADRGSLKLLWIVIGISMFFGFGLAHAVPGASLDGIPGVRIAGIVLFAAGLALRWYSIMHLGRFFTVNVAIAADHRLIDTGPYRLVRHPSYTGALAAFAGLGLCLANWVSLAVILLPVTLVFLRRIRVEEAALAEALGDSYRNYMRRTKRLIPAIY